MVFHLSNVLNIKSKISGTKIVMEGFMKVTNELGFEDEWKLGKEKGKEIISAGRYKISKATQIRIRVTHGMEENYC